MQKLINRQIEIDTHTHTTLSGHAWSTITENCTAAAALGMKGLCLTEHGPAMANSLPWFGPCSYPLLPENINGIHVITGLEFNIIDYNGGLDIKEAAALKHIHFGIASMHDVTLKKGTKLDHTAAYCGALANPYIDILGHPGYYWFPSDIESIVRAAKFHDKLIEINNNSFRARAGSSEICVAIANMCKKLDVRVCVSSDSHFCTMIGRVHEAMRMLDEISFPSELILNLSYERFISYLREKNRL